ncbi:sensor histidine kinase [Blautia acetigignens]|uniref:Histidine kinase n=1 Tax=Blautia acetigignens TaxID=2981783 RepID=A0ABV1CM98_9FIRM
MKHFIQTLTGKITIVILLIVFPVIFMVYQNGRSTRQNWQEQQITKAEDDLALYASSMDHIFDILEETLLYLPINNNSFNQLVSFPQSDTQRHWSLLISIKEQISSIKEIYPFMENIFVYYPEQNLFLNEKVNPEMTAVIRKQAEDFSGSAASSKLWNTVSTANGYYLYWLYKRDGYCLGSWISYDALLSYICQNESTAAADTPTYLLTDFAGNVLTTQGGITVIPREDLGATVEKDGQFFITCQALHPGVYIARILGTAELGLSPHWYSSSFAAVTVLALLLVICVVLCISHWVLTPVKELTQGIEEIASGNIEHRLQNPSGTSLEFEKIETEFNHMMDQLKDMQIQIYQQELEQNETKLRYLSQQIQPHFILNSLNTLYTYSNRDVEATQKIIRLLSQYYRYVVNIESRYVNLGQELDHIENFLKLQKIRFPRKLDYEILCEDGIDIVPIPPFLLESFIGNSLKYGQDEQEKIMIRIQAVQVEPFVIRISVQDQGEGFSPEILEAIEEYHKTHVKNELLGTGIYNCIERLNLIYQDRAQIRCYNALPHGAVVEITIHLNQCEN